MPVRRKNPKKIINNCQLKKDGIVIVRSECPAIKNVRSIRNRLNSLVREQAPVEQIFVIPYSLLSGSSAYSLFFCKEV